MFIDFLTIVKYAWMAYDSSRNIKTIYDISAKVSTNHVYKVIFEDRSSVIAKLSYFGKYEHFVEDHTIINSMSNNLPAPFENFLADSLMKGNSLFVHRFQNEMIDAWVIFYRPIKIKQKLPKRLENVHIEKLAVQFAEFHRACYKIRHTLPPSSKTLKTDIDHLREIMNTDVGRYVHRQNMAEIYRQCNLFFENTERINFPEFELIPVFVDWNIGNFSVTSNIKLYSRWDYDWFRVSSRMMDFYFLSRIVSDIGDKTEFSYTIDQLNEERFLLFLRLYHEIYPFSENEIRFLEEAYRFFILNYVVKDGRYFFQEMISTKLKKEAYEIYFPSLDQKKFDAEKILNVLKI